VLEYNALGVKAQRRIARRKGLRVAYLSTGEKQRIADDGQIDVP
jgi:hypothetical protein